MKITITIVYNDLLELMAKYLEGRIGNLICTCGATQEANWIKADYIKHFHHIFHPMLEE